MVPVKARHVQQQLTCNASERTLPLPGEEASAQHLWVRSCTYLGNELIVVGKMSPAVNAAVGPVARRQICLESLGPCHLHHWSHWALRELWGGPGGTPAGRVARETPEDTGKGRGLAGDGCGAGSTRWWPLQRKRFGQRGPGTSHKPKIKKRTETEHSAHKGDNGLLAHRTI